MLPVLNSLLRLGLVETLVTHANIKGFGITPLSGDCRGYMPTLLKTKHQFTFVFYFEISLQLNVSQILSEKNRYYISMNSFRGNYSFLNLEIVENSNSCRKF